MSNSEAKERSTLLFPVVASLGVQTWRRDCSAHLSKGYLLDGVNDGVNKSAFVLVLFLLASPVHL